MADGDIIINSTGNGTPGRIGIFRDSDRINDFGYCSGFSCYKSFVSESR